MTEPVAAPWNPKFRKRKKSTGEVIDESTAAALKALRPHVDAGMFCKGCRKWVLWKHITFTYPSATERECWCNNCGLMLGTKKVGK